MGVSSENVEPGDEAEVEAHGLTSGHSSGLTSGLSSANVEPGDEGEVEGHALSS
jgi:hypothetical protein